MMRTILTALIFFAAAGPALACQTDDCKRSGDGRRGAEAPASPDAKGAAPIVPLSVPAPDVKAPDRSGPPGAKSACVTDDACSRPGDGRRGDDQTDEKRPRVACVTDNCSRPGDGRRGAEAPARPDAKGAAPIVPLSIPAPDAKAPAKPAPPGAKTACMSDVSCNNRPGN